MKNLALQSENQPFRKLKLIEKYLVKSFLCYATVWKSSVKRDHAPQKKKKFNEINSLVKTLFDEKILIFL